MNIIYTIWYVKFVETIRNVLMETEVTFNLFHHKLKT